jgi:UDP-N-acetylmuramoylalanine--D-glutamate ligase
MIEYKKYFQGKKITVLGLGLLGRGINDIAFLASCGAKLVVTDLKSTDVLAPSLRELVRFSDITYVLGEHRLEDFRNCDLVIKAAGVPLDSPFIAEARKHAIPVKMSTALFAELSPATIVGITGTRGKTTTTYLIYEILKRAGKRVWLGGNIKGVSTLAFLPEVQPGDFAVLELDSWQLQGFAEEKISPHIAVFTTFLSDHLNYYKGDLEAYYNDKSAIYRYQKTGDVCVAGKGVFDYVMKDKPISDVCVAGSEDVPVDWNIQIPGEHNRDNIACAVKATRALGIAEESIRAAVEDFKGVPGRLELLKKVRGVSIYNDTTATTPDATIAALRALGGGSEYRISKSEINKLEADLHHSSNAEEKKIILILGGSDKGLSMERLVPEIPRYCNFVVLLAGTGSEKLKPVLDSLSISYVNADSLSGAVSAAFEKARSGDTILFSPAFASFGMFKNEYDRGDQFTALISNLV